MSDDVKVAKWTRVTGDQRVAMTKSLRAMYEHGMSIREISDATGRSYGAVHRMLIDSGVQLRPRGNSMG